MLLPTEEETRLAEVSTPPPHMLCVCIHPVLALRSIQSPVCNLALFVSPEFHHKLFLNRAHLWICMTGSRWSLSLHLLNSKQAEGRHGPGSCGRLRVRTQSPRISSECNLSVNLTNRAAAGPGRADCSEGPERFTVQVQIPRPV